MHRFLTLLILICGCATESAEPVEDVLATTCLHEGTAGATSACLTPQHSADYYADQASKYFDTLDIGADPQSVPNYSDRVARWEWPPWLWLTGYTRETMIETGNLLKQVDPSTVPERDCRGFDTQPFARCYVVFEYEEGPCPIYEEFTFNDQGEMTFIEAWSNRPHLVPTTGDDPWGEQGIDRLSTRVPGLGNAEGRIDLESEWMVEASKDDEILADFALRASDQWNYWSIALAEAPNAPTPRAV